MRYLRDEQLIKVPYFDLKLFCAFWFGFFATFGMSEPIDENPNTPYPPVEQAVSFEYYAYLLEELDYRRRLQFLFNNPQSIFDGLAIGYVQTSKGNLTFERRDLVVLGTESVVASRVYDSHQASNSGFGPGWRLNLIESIHFLDEEVVYTQGSGAKQRFKQNASGQYVPSHSTPVNYDTFLSILGPLAILKHADGSVRYFRQVETTNRFVLTQIEKPSGTTIFLNYDGRRLVEVVRAGEAVLQLDWSENRISVIKDMQGRQVTYAYDSLGRLSSARDIGNQSWTYDYDRSDRLTVATHPDGQPYLEVSYDEFGRVFRSTTVRDFEFRYYVNATTVIESDGNRHHFKKNDSGITVGYRNERDLRWDLSFDPINRPVQLEKNGKIYRFHYADSKLILLEHPDGAQRLHYDEEGRFTHDSGVAIGGRSLKSVLYEEGSKITVNDRNESVTFSLNDAQQVESIVENGIEYNIDYDERGFVSSLSQADISISFTRNPIGRIESVRYPNDDVSRYGYDELGNRDLLNYSSGAKMEIEHDGRGNIVRVNDITSEGIKLTQSYTIDQYNRITRVEFLESTPLDVAYDELGRPAWFRNGEEIVGVEYLGDGYATRLRAGQRTYTLNAEQEDSVYHSVTASPRAFLHNDSRSNYQPGYGSVAIHPLTMDARIVPVEQYSVPGYQTITSALLTTKSWLRKENRQKNEKPSNPIFQPPEYESTNCCLECDWSSECGQHCTTYYGTGEATCLCGESVYPSNNLGGNSGGGGSSCTPSNSSSKETANQTVSSSLAGAPYSTYEQAFRSDCPDPNQIAKSWETAAYNMCIELSAKPTKTLYLGHTHPLFEWDRDYLKRIHCGRTFVIRIESDGDVERLNEGNENCSDYDNKVGNKYPLLLRTPTGGIKNCGSKR